MWLVSMAWILISWYLHQLVAGSTQVSGSGEVSVNGPIIGIDLGTSFSCVGVLHNGNLEIIANDQGNRVTPSYVALSQGDLLVGEVAKNQVSLNPKNTAFQVKRIIGRRWSDPQLQEDINKFPFQVVDLSDRPYVKLASSETVKLLSPEQISGMVLNKMKQTAEVFVGKKIHKAVVTVPAYFTDAQRRATKDAANIAGLEVMRIVNEPTAAAIAHGKGKRYRGIKTLLVFDLGGGTFDVSVVKINNGKFTVLATSGDTHLGGEDFDNRVVQHFINVFNRKYWKQGEVLNFQSQDTKVLRAIQRLRKEVELGKKALSSKMTRVIRIEIDSFYAGIDFSEKLTRATFEELNIDLFKKVNVPLENVLQDATLNKDDIDEVLLVGGSTKIPKIQELVKDFFEGIEPVQNINPDEAVAVGAAILAGELAGEQQDMLQDVIPMSLGKATCHNFDPEDCDNMSIIILRNTLTSRADVSKIYTTTEDEQDNVLIEVYEGENKVASSNNFLGSFILTGLKLAPRGVPQIRVNFKVDTDGILHVTAQEIGTNNRKEITIIGDQNRLNHEERLVATKQVQQLEIENIHDEL